MSSKPQKPVLYSYWRSSCAWRIRIALSHKGIDYDYVSINLLDKNSIDDPVFLAASPMKRVPVFVDKNGVALVESPAILEYLDEAYPEKPLMPKDLVQRAHVRAIANHIGAAMQPLQNLGVLRFLNEKEQGYGQKFAAHWLTVGFDSLEKLLSQFSGKYSVGDELSLADLYLPSIVYNAKRFNVPLEHYEHINKVNNALSQLTAFQGAVPDAQPDAGLNA